MTTPTRGRAPSSTAGVGTMLAIQWRTGWRSLLAWVLGIALMMLLTASSLRGLYPTQADLDRYAATLTGGAVYVLNGRVAGVDTLGGAMSNEFALFGAFAVPILAVAVMARFTRSEEENGRLRIAMADRGRTLLLQQLQQRLSAFCRHQMKQAKPACHGENE